MDNAIHELVWTLLCVTAFLLGMGIGWHYGAARATHEQGVKNSADHDKL